MRSTLDPTDEGERIDILAAARTNEAFRRVMATGDHEQVVVMTLPVGGEIGEEVHPATDQLFIFVDGHGEVTLAGNPRPVAANDLVFVHAGTLHNILNRGTTPLRLITVYAPPQHAPGTVHLTKADAERAESAEH